MTSVIIFLVILFLSPVLAIADAQAFIQPSTAADWKHVKTCPQAVAVATRQAASDMQEIGVPLTPKQLKPVVKAKLETIKGSPCYQPSKASKHKHRSQN